jgi:hypothetical protein
MGNSALNSAGSRSSAGGIQRRQPPVPRSWGSPPSGSWSTALLFMAGRKDDLNIKGAFLHMASDVWPPWNESHLEERMPRLSTPQYKSVPRRARAFSRIQ